MIALLAMLAAATSPDAPKKVARTMELTSERSAEALAAGHYGKLTLHSVIEDGGKLGSLRVAESSGSDLLDNETLASLEGGSIRGSQTGDLVAIEIDYLPFHPDNIPGYTCQQATRDLGWWESLSPDNEATNSSIYHMLSGLLLIATMDKGSSAEVAARYKAFRANFGTAVERCAGRPDDSFLATAVTSD